MTKLVPFLFAITCIALSTCSVPSSCYSLLQSPSSSGKSFLRDLVSGKDERVQAVGALPGIGLDKSITPTVARALQQTWMHGARKLVSPKQRDDIRKGDSLLFDDRVIEQQSVMQYGNCTLASESSPIYKIHPDLEILLAQIFGTVVTSKAYYGCNTTLSRFDLFHGHLFRTELSTEQSLIGILFHCAEYPATTATDAITADIDSTILCGMNLGYCQADSDCYPTLHDWRYRNVLWSAWWTHKNNALTDASKIPLSSSSSQKMVPPIIISEKSVQHGIWLLDGQHSEISKLRVDTTPFGKDCPNTVWEGHLGDHVGDIYNVSNILCCTHLPQYIHSLSDW